MKIGYDISQTGASKAGCGYFADSLIRHLATIDPPNSYILYPTFGDLYWDPCWRESTVKPAGSLARSAFSPGTFEESRQFWRHPPRDFERILGDPDVIHSNNFFCPRGLSRARLIYTLYDLGFLENPSWTTEENRSGCFAGVFEASLRSDLILSISEFSRTHFLRTFPHYPEDRIVVVRPASRLANVLPIKPSKMAELTPRGFWLTVGTLEPRKNHVRLLRAYAKRLRRPGGTLPLVIAGGEGWLMEEFRSTLNELQLQDRVLLAGYVDDAELVWLYRNCFCFLYPSLFEGFGLPVVEAMEQGAAIISSNSSSLPEIVGSAAVLVDPYQEDEICAAMEKLATGEIQPEVLRRQSLQKAREFSWDAVARQVSGLYHQVQAMPRISEDLIRRSR